MQKDFVEEQMSIVNRRMENLYQSMKAGITDVEGGGVEIKERFTNESRFKFCKKVVARTDECITKGGEIGVSKYQ